MVSIKNELISALRKRGVKIFIQPEKGQITYCYPYEQYMSWYYRNGKNHPGQIKFENITPELIRNDVVSKGDYKNQELVIKIDDQLYMIEYGFSYQISNKTLLQPEFALDGGKILSEINF